MGDSTKTKRRKLTPKLIDSLEAREKRYEVRDATTPAIKVRITRFGAKTLSVVYRSPVTSRRSRVTLGRWPTAPGTDKIAFLRELRVEAAQVLADVARGEDPALLRREAKHERRERDRQAQDVARGDQRRARTFGRVAEQYLESQEAQQLASWDRMESQIRYHWQRSDEAIWDHPIEELRAPNLMPRIDRLLTEGLPGGAAQAKKHAGIVLSFALRMGYTTGNVATAIRLRKPPTRARALSPDELGAAWVATSQVKPPWRSVFRLLLLTACRKTEILAMRWDEISDDGLWLDLSPERTKMDRPRRVALSELARKELALIPHVHRSTFVFPNRSGRGCLKGIQKPKAGWIDAMLDVLDEHGKSGGSFRLHDLRHTAKTRMHALGIADNVSEAILGHEKRGIQRIYDHFEMLDEQRDALEGYASAIEHLARPFLPFSFNNQPGVGSRTIKRSSTQV